MSDSDTRMKSMLFEYGTTYKTDYQHRDLTEPVLTTYKPKKRSERIRHPQLRDVHTMSDWKAAAIPFDLLLKPKDILRTDPKSVQKRYEKPIDAGRVEAQKTRPRLILTPAVSMDDVMDVRARNILCEDMYTSSTMRAMREAVSPYLSVKAPLPGLPTNANPVVLPKLQVPVVSSEWRMESASWDGEQLRAFCDPTRDFWLKHELNKCRACDETKAINDHRKMLRQNKAGRR